MKNIFGHRIRVIGFILFTSVLITSCGGGAGNQTYGGRANQAYFGFPYNALEHSISIFGKSSVVGVIQLSHSRDTDAVIFSKVGGNGEIELYEMKSNASIPHQITNNEAIEFDPAISNSGKVAYSVHEYSVGVSKLHYENIALNLPSGLYGHNVFEGERLVSARYDETNNESFIVVYDAGSGSVTSYSIPLYPDYIESTGFGDVVIDGALADGSGMTSLKMNIATGGYAYLCRAPCLRSIPSGAYIDLATLSEFDALKELTLRSLETSDPLCNLSMANNHLGRLAWGGAYRLEALLELYNNDQFFDQNTRITKPFVKRLVNGMIENLLSSYSADVTLIGWPTKKYSLDRQTKLSLMVNNATIMNALLMAYNDGVISDSATKARVVQISKALYAYYEPDFDSNLNGYGGYRFRKDVKYIFDGVVLPFNQSNSFGLAVMQLYQATNDPIYRERVISLAKSFNSQITTTGDNRILWHYWPADFYKGWSASDSISINTPSRPQSNDQLFEDVSHAGINISFIFEINKLFPNLVFDASTIDRVRNMRDKLQIGKLWARFISGDTSYTKASLLYIPDGRWAASAPNILTDYKYGIPRPYPYFEGDPAFSYVAFGRYASSGYGKPTP